MTHSSHSDHLFLPEPAEILDAVMMTESEKHLVLRLKSGKPLAYEPGQIVECGLPGFGEIPLGLSSSPTRRDNFELVVRRVGRVSTGLINVKKGDTVHIRGPLGRGFPLEELRNRDILIVAGGIGLCPTRSLIRYILDRRSEFRKFTLFFGCRSPQEQLFQSDLALWRNSREIEYFETVDRADAGWKGNVGLITSLFSHTWLDAGTRVIICGPPVMYKYVLRELNKFSILEDNVYIDLERRMKCGVGKCGHCQINEKYVCTDGPVFRYAEIMNLEEAI